MKRSEFIRRSILGAIGLAIAPALDLAPKLPALPARRFFIFKVSAQILGDKNLFEMMLDQQIKSLGERGNLIETSIGYLGDDFVKNIYTVMLTFN